MPEQHAQRPAGRAAAGEATGSRASPVQAPEQLPAAATEAVHVPAQPKKLSRKERYDKFEATETRKAGIPQPLALDRAKDLSDQAGTFERQHASDRD